MASDRLFNEFIVSRQLRDSTIKTYTRPLKLYFEVTGKNVTELIQEAEDEEDRGVKRRKRKIREYFIKYIQLLESRGFAPNTIRLYLSRIKTIYHEYDITTPRIKYQKKNTDNISLEDLITLDELKQVLSIAKQREKALILLHLTSGMGAAEVINLRVRDFENAIGEDLIGADYRRVAKKIIDDQLIGVWNVRRVKTGMPYVTFTTPEANYHITEYLKYRDHMNIPIRESDELLFVTRNRNKFRSDTYSKIFSMLNDYMGLGRLGNDRRRLTSHRLRKLFASTLYREGMDKLMVDWLMGHKIDSVTEAYFKANIEHLKGEYEKRMHALTFEKAIVRRVTSDEVKEIIHELEEREREIQELRESQERLREWVKKTEKLYDLIMSDPKILDRIKKK